MLEEPPVGYVAFVERHLDPLRRDAELAADDPIEAERLYTEVLTDVAARWSWLELARTRFGRVDAADRYLWHAFGRRVERPAAGPGIDIEVWDEAPAPTRHARPASTNYARPAPTNAAVRLARQAPSLFQIAIGPLVEAAVAWRHAYAAARRRRLVGRFAVGFVILMILVRVRLNLPAD